MNKNALISLRGIRVDFDDEPVLKGIDLDIMDKEFITFLGPSGCGKTTTLRIIGGFIQPKEGDVFFGGVRINDLPPYKREVNTVFQRYALFPHLNVYENVEFGLKIAKVPEKERRQSVKEMLKLVGLSDMTDAISISFPAVSSSVWPSPARWSIVPRSCFWMNPSALWISSSARKCRSS